MTKKWTAIATAIIVCLAIPGFADSDEPEMDPLLKLLVEQGVITTDQARAVQTEYDRREAGTAAEPAPAVAAAEASPAPQVADAASPAPAPAEAKPVETVPAGLKGLSIGTQVYLSYQNGNTPSGEDFNLFRIKRGYIDIRKTITPYFAARITPDVQQDASGDLNVRLKYAYGQFSWNWDGLIQKPHVEFGVAHMPWLDFEEHINRFRMQDTMFMERNGLFNSADLGVYFGGNFGRDMPDDFKKNVQSHFAGRWGSFGVGVYNGGGYHGIEKNTNKAIEGRLTVRPLPDIVPGLQISGFGVWAKGNQANTPEGTVPDMQVLAGMISYESRRLVLAAQYESGEGNQSGTAVGADGKALPHDGFSVFTEIRLDRQQRFSLLGRYDRFTTDRDNPDRDVKERIIAGVAWQFFKGNYWVLDYDRLEHTIPGLETEDRVQLTLQIKY
jgi:hypothetical protein